MSSIKAFCRRHTQQTWISRNNLKFLKFENLKMAPEEDLFEEVNYLLL